MSKIAFVHPDLGIGGAERLVVDAAVGLQELGNEVRVYTSHCDLSHCFDEVSSRVLKVSVFGDFLPIAILGKFHILCAILRQLYLVLRLVVTGEILQYDYFVVDQLSFCVPLLSIFSKKPARVFFYCHFPDQKLVRKGGLIKKVYRLPFNAIEEWTTGVSDLIAVNSKFTKSIFHETFTNLSSIDPAVIYPCIDVHQPEQDNSAGEEELLSFLNQSKFFLSINRFERLKNVALAVKAYAEFKQNLPSDVTPPKLIIAGGFDARVRENVEYLQDLEALCKSMNLVHYTFRGKLVMMPRNTEVIFLPSVKTSVKNAALKHAELLLYTPTFEHFGIVPVESMLNRTPVLAINRGGPLESIVSFDGTNLTSATGYNRPDDVTEWASIMTSFFLDLDNSTKSKLGENGFRRAHEVFSRDQMRVSIQRELDACSKTTKNKGILFNMLSLWKFWLGASGVAMSAMLWVAYK